MNLSTTFRSRSIAPAVIGFLLALPCPASASRFGIAAFGGFQQYGMRDANTFIGETSDQLDTAAFPDHFALENIDQGLGFGGGLRYDLRGNLLLSLDVTRLTASTSNDAEVQGATGSAEVTMPGSAFTVTGTHFFPSDTRVRFGLGGGLGYYRCSGSATMKVASVDTIYNYSGGGLGFHGQATVDAALSGALHLEISGGVRYAKTGGLEVDGGSTLLKLDGAEVRADWSGVLTRVGLAYYFGGGGE